MLLFGPLHVLILYGFKRVSGILDRDEAVFEEIQKRAAKVPPAQRQAAIDAMKLDRARITQQVYTVKKQEQEFSDAFNFMFWCIWWAIAVCLCCIFGISTTFWIVLVGSVIAFIASFWIG